VDWTEEHLVRTIRRRHPGGAIGIVLLSITVLLVLPACGSGEDETPAGAVTGFQEMGEAAGLRFHMTFLTGEQGETFKINLYDHGSGVCVSDYDGDGLDDIYLLNQLGTNGLFRNRGDGTFADVTAEAGVGMGDRICSSASFADIDNDGDQDLFVASTRGGNLLFRNDGKGRFEDVTAAAGLELVAHTQGVSFFDFDSDGDLDLYLTNTAGWTLDFRDPAGRYFVGQSELFDLVQSTPEKNVLYRNEGDGTFVDVTEETGAAGEGWGGDIATFDADGDGDQDLFVTNMFGVSILLRNEEGKRFTNVTQDALGITSWGAVGCKPLDYNGDGRLDLFVTDMHSDMWMSFDMTPEDMEESRRFGGPEGPMVERGLMDTATANQYWDLVLLNEEIARRVIFGNTLYQNLGNGRFEEVSARANVETLWPWSIATADYDLDGREDAFIASGMGYPYFPWPNALLMSAGDGTFVRRERDAGVDPRPGGGTLRYIRGERASRSSRSAAVIDFDADGRPDLVVNNFNERPYLYRNRFAMKHWVALRLTGTRSNRDAIGALARLEAGDTVQVRQVCGAGGYLAQSTKTLYFGLGDRDTIDRCVVIWPSGTRQELRDLAPDRLHDVTEPESR
jgi:hypothetical protein